METNIVEELQFIATEGSCIKKLVGCRIVLGEEVLVEAPNERPGKETCLDGKCYRCLASKQFAHGRDHDLCSCLHAEQNAISAAARKGIALEGSWLYSSYQPCLSCLKLIVGAGISAVRYAEAWEIPVVEEVPNLADDYKSLMAELEHGCELIEA